MPPRRSSGGFDPPLYFWIRSRRSTGHEQLRVGVIAELEKLLHDVAVADRDLLEADELADAVIDVNDQVADLEVAQVGEEGRRQRARALAAAFAPFLFEDVGFDVDLEGLGA